MGLKEIVKEFEFYDKVNKEKSYLDYMQDKSLDFLKYLYLQSINVNPRELIYENNSDLDIENKNKLEVIEYIMKNLKKDFNNKLEVLTEEYLVLLRVFVENRGYIELNEKSIINIINEIAILRNIGFIFIGLNKEKNKLSIHMPNDIYNFLYKIFYTEKIKKVSITIQKNTELYKVIEGIVVAYGTVNYDEIFDMIFEDFQGISIDRMYNILFFGSYILEKNYYMQENVISYAKEISDMYFDDEDENFKYFSKDEFINLANHTVYTNLNEYGQLREVIKGYINGNNAKVIEKAEKIINIFLFAEQVSPGSGDIYLEANIEKIIKGSKESLDKFKTLLNLISRKMPKWIYNGYSVEEKELLTNDNNKINKKIVYEAKVKIKDIKGSITRKLQIPSGISLNQLAAIIILAFDWSGYSEYAFKVGRTKYYKDIQKENNIFGFTIDDAFENTKKIRFLYNINDINHKYIEHEIELINKYNTDIELKYPKCIDYKGVIDVMDTNLVYDNKVMAERISMLDTVFLLELEGKEIRISNEKVKCSINNKIMKYMECSNWLLCSLKEKLGKNSLEIIEKKYTKFINNIIKLKK